jgi:purine-cytosine permease-like protein
MIKSRLGKRIDTIEQRNISVEADKAWETSWTRKGAIALLTYFVVVIYLQFVVQIEPWFNALVPVVGYLLSTLTINFLKKIWIVRHINKNKLKH